MKDFGDILDEMKDQYDEEGNLIKKGLSCTELRYKYIDNLYKITGRNIVTYYAGFLEGRDNTSICDDDLTGFISAVSNMDKTKGLDLILHTPGGDGDAAEGIVKYLHNVFGNDIRVIIPDMAFSAGTMIACSAKTILMSSHSFLGPTDPQMGNEGTPAYNIINEFNHAMDDLEENPNRKAYWEIELSKYPKAYYYYVWDCISVGRSQVEEWLKKYMFGEEKNKKKVATKVRKITRTLIRGEQMHSKHFDINDCKEMGLNVESLEDKCNEKLNEAITYLHYAYVISFDYTNTAKYIENQFKKSYIVMSTNSYDEDEDYDDEDDNEE